MNATTADRLTVWDAVKKEVVKTTSVRIQVEGPLLNYIQIDHLGSSGETLQPRSNPLVPVPAIRTHTSRMCHQIHSTCDICSGTHRTSVCMYKKQSHCEMQQLQRQPCDCIQGVPCQTCERTSNPDIHSAEAEEGTRSTRCATIRAIHGRLPDCKLRFGEKKSVHQQCQLPNRQCNPYQGNNSGHCLTQRTRSQGHIPPPQPQNIRNLKEIEGNLACRDIRSHSTADDHRHTILVTQLQQVQPLLAIRTEGTRELKRMMIDCYRSY